MTISAKKLHRRRSTGFSNAPPIGKVLLRWGVGRLQVHGICSSRLVHREVAKARSNYLRTYLCWFRNPAFGDSTGSNVIEKDRLGVPPGLFWEKWGEGVMWFLCVAPLCDCANGDCVDVLAWWVHVWWVWF